MAMDAGRRTQLEQTQRPNGPGLASVRAKRCAAKMLMVIRVRVSIAASDTFFKLGKARPRCDEVQGTFVKLRLYTSGREFAAAINTIDHETLSKIRRNLGKNSGPHAKRGVVWPWRFI